MPAGAQAVQVPEGANYYTHLSALACLLALARDERASGELAVNSAQAMCLRGENLLAAALRMEVGVCRHDFGPEHKANMHAVSELLTVQLATARTTRRLTRESLSGADDLIRACTHAAAAFQADHGQLAEAHANTSHAAKTREAYQPL